MATSAVQTWQRCLSRCKRKPDHYRKGGGCNFWFRHSRNKTYWCTKNYPPSSWRVWETTQKKCSFQHRKVMLWLCSCNSSPSAVLNVIYLRIYTCQIKKQNAGTTDEKKPDIRLLTPEICSVYHSQRWHTHGRVFPQTCQRSIGYAIATQQNWIQWGLAKAILKLNTQPSNTCESQNTTKKWKIQLDLHKAKQDNRTE